MMKTKTILLALMAVVLSVGFSACGDDEIAPSNGGNTGNGEPSPQEQVASTSVTGGVYDIGILSATFTGYVNLTPTELTTATFGIIWGAVEDLKWDNKAGYASSRDLETNKYSVTTHDLWPERKYFYRSYVCLNGNTYVYGTVKSFTTQTVQIEIQTGEVTDVGITSATLSASVQNFSSELSVSFLSIIWGTNEDLNWENKISYASCHKLEDGNYSVSASRLSPETKYYYRAYCNVRGKYVYGDVKSFTTTPEPEKAPYALWCRSNTTLYFIGSDVTLEVGSTYDNQTITSLWHGDDIVAQSTDTAAWHSILGNAKYVVFEESFKEIKPKNLSHWFYSAKILSSIYGLKFLNTSEATDMSYMFNGCSSLTSLDVSHFDTQKVTSMSSMFRDCSSLTTIYCNDTWSCRASSYMFSGCERLVGAIAYDKNKTDVKYANPDTGYFTRK